MPIALFRRLEEVALSGSDASTCCVSTTTEVMSWPQLFDGSRTVFVPRQSEISGADLGRLEKATGFRDCEGKVHVTELTTSCH